MAEFIPAFNLRGLTFESRGTEMDRNMGGSESGEDIASGDQSSETDGGDIPEGITIRATKPVVANGGANGHTKNAKSVDSTKAASEDGASIKTSGTKRTAKSTATAGTAPPQAQSGIEMSREELFKARKYPTFSVLFSEFYHRGEEANKYIYQNLVF